MTDQQYQEWLLSEYAHRVLLVEVEYYDVVSTSTKTLYFSSLEYTTGSTYTDGSYVGVGGTPNNTWYRPAVVGGFDFAQSLDIFKGSFSFNWGSINIDNAEGVLDYLIRDGSNYHIFRNQVVRLYLGDSEWERPDFRQIFYGIIDDISVYDSNTITIRFKDRLQLFNQPINVTASGVVRTLDELYKDRHAGTPMPIGNSRYQERDKPLPVCFGDCFNITPLNVDWVYADDTVSGNYFMIHDGQIAEVVAVRDNGITLPPASYDVFLSEGVIRITAPAFGNITCDVRGAEIYEANTFVVTGATAAVTTATGTSVYVSDLPNLLLNLLTNYGIIQNRLGVVDFDLVTMYDYLVNTAVSDGTGNAGLVEVCYYGSSADNIINIVNSLSSSLSTELIITEDSKFSLLLISLPEEGTPAFTLGIADVIDKEFKVKGIESPSVNSVTIGYAKNFTPSTELAFMVPGPQKEILQREYNELTGEPTVPVNSNYNLPDSPSSPEGTDLIEQVRATQEASRRANRLCRRSIVISVGTTPIVWSLKLGSCITLQYPRYGFDSGVNAVVIGKYQNVTKGTFTMDLLV